eukprot:180977-Pleurochrysis_carterae.AAC.1
MQAGGCVQTSTRGRACVLRNCIGISDFQLRRSTPLHNCLRVCGGRVWRVGQMIPKLAYGARYAACGVCECEMNSQR